MAHATSSAELYEKLNAVTTIRESSRKQYAKRLRQLEGICGEEIIKILKNPDESMKKIRVSSGLTTTGARANALAVLLSVLKHCDLSEKEVPKKTRKRWSELHAEEQLQATTEFTSGTTKTALKWSRVHDKNEELYTKAMGKGAYPKDVTEALMSSFYVDLEPRRQEDYIRLYVKTEASEVSPESSYVDMSVSKPVLHVGEYKTSRSMKAWHKELPERLAILLKYSLMLEPRKYVFVGRDGEAYKTAGAWAKHHNGKLSKWYGEGSTVMGLRHARATAVSHDTRYSAKERAEIARDMGHGTTTNMAYAQNEDTQELPDGSFRITRFDRSEGRFAEYGCTRISPL